jgi:hypothetical protein
MTEKEADVRKRLFRVIVTIETVSLALMFFVLLRHVSPDTTGIVILLLLPIAFGMHVTEEFICPGGFIAWDNIFRPQFIDTAGSFYVKVNALPAMAALLIVVAGLISGERYIGLVVPTWLTIVTFMSWNAVFHLRGAIRTQSYSPGMVTGLALFFPLTVVGFVYFLYAGLPPLIAVVSGALAFLVQPILNLAKKSRQKAA